MENIKGIIFDYGGTIDSHGDHWSEIIWEGYARAGVSVDKETFRRAYVETEREFARRPVITPDDTFADVMAKKMESEMGYLAQWGAISADEATSKAPVAAAYCYAAARASVDDARPTLDYLAARYPLVLVSNFYGNIGSVLSDFALSHYFKTVVESAVVGVRKPDPAIFALGVKALGLEPRQTLVVGDSYRKDILPARSLGCATAWLKGRGWTAEEDAVTDPCQIDSLSRLTQIL